jgi:hypothetical protein
VSRADSGTDRLLLVAPPTSGFMPPRDSCKLVRSRFVCTGPYPAIATNAACRIKIENFNRDIAYNRIHARETGYMGYRSAV